MTTTHSFSTPQAPRDSPKVYRLCVFASCLSIAGILHVHKDIPIAAELVGKGLYGFTEKDIALSAAPLYFGTALC